MKRFGMAVLVALMVLGTVAGAGAKEFLSIATGGTTGTYYPLGGGIAEIINNHMADVQVTAETGNASAANVNLIGSGQIEMAFAQNDIAYWGWKGENMFKDKAYTNIRGVGVLYPEHVHLITLQSAGVKVFGDVKGKRISAGAPGSGVEGDVRAIFDVAGMTYDDVKADFLDFANTTSRFKDGQLDAGFVVGGYPVASIMDLATTAKVDLVNFDVHFFVTKTGHHTMRFFELRPPDLERHAEKPGRLKRIETGLRPTPMQRRILIVGNDIRFFKHRPQLVFRQRAPGLQRFRGLSDSFCAAVPARNGLHPRGVLMKNIVEPDEEIADLLVGPSLAEIEPLAVALMIDPDVHGGIR